jgi:Ca2+-binding EF-hand superfamily protein
MPSTADYEKFFDEADADGSGSLTFNELLKVLKKKGYKGSEDDIKQYFRQVDTSGDGQVSKEEYLVAMGLIPPKDHKTATMRSVFYAFDKNGDGQIDRAELKQVFAEMGKHFTDAELQRMIQIADPDKSGTLNYEEFVAQVFGQ